MMKIFAVLLVAAGLAASAAEPSATPDPRVAELANQLSKAANSAEQDKLSGGAEPSLRAAALIELVDRAYQLSVHGDYVGTESLCNLVERLAKVGNDDGVLAQARSVHATVFREYGEYSEALKQLDLSLSYFEKHPEDRGVVGCYQNRGIIYLNQGDFARALVNFQRAL